MQFTTLCEINQLEYNLLAYVATQVLYQRVLTPEITK